MVAADPGGRRPHDRAAPVVFCRAPPGNSGHAIPEGTGTVLDNTLVIWGSEVGKGNTHAMDNVPFTLAGSAGGAIRTGGSWIELRHGHRSGRGAAGMRPQPSRAPRRLANRWIGPVQVESRRYSSWKSPPV
jgi:hypothetical protein